MATEEKTEEQKAPLPNTPENTDNEKKSNDKESTAEKSAEREIQEVKTTEDVIAQKEIAEKEAAEKEIMEKENTQKEIIEKENTQKEIIEKEAGKDHADTAPEVPQRGYSQQAYEDAYEDLYAEILEHFRSFSPSEQVAGRITREHITEYLEGSREERLLAFKERREKRFLTALEILAALTAIVLIVWFLKENPAILVNILYLIGGLGIFFIWRQPHKKDSEKEK